MRQQERTIEEIEAEIARSRTEIERTSQALKQSVNSEHLSEAAQQVLLQGTIRLEEKVKDLAGSAGDQVEKLGTIAIDAIRKNPVPALVAGMGLSLLISIAERDSRTAFAQASLLGPSDNVGPGQTTPPDSVPRKILQKARGANLRHPVLVGAAVFGVGLLLGALIPNSKKEDALMGQHRERLLADGKATARQIWNQAKSTIHEEVDKRRAEAADVKDDMEAVAMQAFHQARLESLEPNDAEPS